MLELIKRTMEVIGFTERRKLSWKIMKCNSQKFEQNFENIGDALSLMHKQRSLSNICTFQFSCILQIIEIISNNIICFSLQLFFRYSNFERQMNEEKLGTIPDALNIFHLQSKVFLSNPVYANIKLFRIFLLFLISSVDA